MVWNVTGPTRYLHPLRNSSGIASAAVVGMIGWVGPSFHMGPIRRTQLQRASSHVARRRRVPLAVDDFAATFTVVWHPHLLIGATALLSLSTVQKGEG